MNGASRVRKASRLPDYRGRNLQGNLKKVQMSALHNPWGQKDCTDASNILRWPGIEPGSHAWKAWMLTIIPPTLISAGVHIIIN